MAAAPFARRRSADARAALPAGAPIPAGVAAADPRADAAGARGVLRWVDPATPSRPTGGRLVALDRRGCPEPTPRPGDRPRPSTSRWSPARWWSTDPAGMRRERAAHRARAAPGHHALLAARCWPSESLLVAHRRRRGPTAAAGRTAACSRVRRWRSHRAALGPQRRDRPATASSTTGAADRRPARRATPHRGRRTRSAGSTRARDPLRARPDLADRAVPAVARARAAPSAGHRTATPARRRTPSRTCTEPPPVRPGSTARPRATWPRSSRRQQRGWSRSPSCAAGSWSCSTCRPGCRRAGSPTGGPHFDSSFAAAYHPWLGVPRAAARRPAPRSARAAVGVRRRHHGRAGAAAGLAVGPGQRAGAGRGARRATSVTDALPDRLHLLVDQRLPRRAGRLPADGGPHAVRRPGLPPAERAPADDDAAPDPGARRRSGWSSSPTPPRCGPG